jgi:Cu/Ag efflux protein CusF
MTRTLCAFAVTIIWSVITPGMAAAQVKVIPGESETVTATVEAVDHATRTVSLKLADGTFETIVAPASVERFDAIKVGDTLTARYYDNIVLRVKKPGEKDVDTGGEALTKTPGTSPGATAARQRTITATITAIDMNVPSITLTGPNGWKYSSRVQDVAALKTVKVGDKLDITWTEALLVGFTHAKK